MQKALSLVLVLCFLFSLPACKKGNLATTESNDQNFCLECGTEVSITDKLCSSCAVANNTPNSTDSKPDSSSNTSSSESPASSTPLVTETFIPNTPVHTHSYSNATCTDAAKCACGDIAGSALGHSWNDSPCSTSKTCSVCMVTEEKNAEHVVSGDTCALCGQIVAINPNQFQEDTVYSCIGAKYDGEHFGYPKEYDCYVITYLEFKGYSHSQVVYNESSTKDPGGYFTPFQHEGKYYCSLTQWNGISGQTSYKIEEMEIIATIKYNYSSEMEIIFELLSNNTLKVKAISGLVLSEECGIQVGTIFYPNADPYANE